MWAAPQISKTGCQVTEASHAPEKTENLLSDSVWNEAIRRIGWENLRVKILEYVPEGVSLKERECWWIRDDAIGRPEIRLQFKSGRWGTDQAHGRGKGEDERKKDGSYELRPPNQ